MEEESRAVSVIYNLPSALKVDVNVNHVLSDRDFALFANVAVTGQLKGSRYQHVM